MVECAVANCSVCQRSLSGCDQCNASLVSYTVSESGISSCMANCPAGSYRDGPACSCMFSDPPHLPPIEFRILLTESTDVRQPACLTARPAWTVKAARLVRLVQVCCWANATDRVPLSNLRRLELASTLASATISTTLSVQV